jgi:hypothetical protein
VFALLVFLLRVLTKNMLKALKTKLNSMFVVNLEVVLLDLRLELI